MRPRKDSARHGTRTMYSKGCMCGPCVLAAKRYRYEYATGQRRAGYVPPTTAKRHTETLLAKGMSRRQIGRAAGVDDATLVRVLEGEGRIQLKTQDDLLAIDPHKPLHELVEEGAYIPASDTAKTLLRLWGQGYSLGVIADQVHISDSTVRKIAHGHTAFVRARIARDTAEWADFVGDSKGLARDRKPLGKRAGTNHVRVRTSDPDPVVAVDLERMTADLSDTDLSRMTGVSARDLIRIRARHTCKLSTLSRIAGALYVREDDLMVAV